VSYFLKKAAKIEKGAKLVGRETAGRVTQAQLREIAESKMVDLNAYDVDAAVEMIKGSARSMGIEVLG
jgi:large subunit ribosomal protein L11